MLALPAFIVLAGLALRLWGIGWSLPDARHPLATYHPDELVNLGAAQAADLLAGEFDIGFYNYGAFYFYLVSFAHILGRGWGAIPPPPPPESAAMMALLAPHQAGLFLAGRLVTALLGTATIAALFALGNRCYGRKAGLAAAFLYAAAPLAVVHAHFLTVDVPATFFVTLALLWAARLLDSTAWKEVVLAGVWVGLAAATKYNAVLVLAAPVAALFLRPSDPGAKPDRLPKLGALLGVAVLAFLVGCPGPLLNPDVFWNGAYPGSGVRYELFEHSRAGHGELFTDTGSGWGYHLAISLRYGLGIPLLLLALCGFVLACLRRAPADRVLLAFFLLYFLASGLSAVRFARYMLPLFPVLCLWAARLATEPFPRASVSRLAAGMGAAVALFTAMQAVSLSRLMAAPDPRDAAADYLEKTAPQGASVAFAKVPWFFSPPLSPLFGALRSDVRARAAAETTRFQLRIPDAEWDTGVLAPPPDYVVLSNIETMHAVERLRQENAVRFVQSIPANYRRQLFAPAVPVFGLFPGVLIPEDLLYIMPTLTLYAKNEVSP